MFSSFLTHIVLHFLNEICYIIETSLSIFNRLIGLCVCVCVCIYLHVILMSITHSSSPFEKCIKSTGFCVVRQADSHAGNCVKPCIKLLTSNCQILSNPCFAIA